MSDNFVLIGFMGAGKSSVGRLLAQKTGKQFMDTDELIVKQMNLSINDIFATYGEEYFRDLETNLVKALSENVSNAVISVGGGLALREENRVYLKKIGTVVYLSVNENTVIRRLKGDTSRPLLRGTKEEVKEKVGSLLNARKPIYEDASNLVIKTDRLTKDEIVDRIIECK